MKDDKKIEKMLAQYTSKKEVYRDYAEIVKVIFEKILKLNKLNYQVVTFREKEVGSLKNKLNKPVSETDKRPLIEKIKTVEEVKDLAGCRVIFYLEKDIGRLVNLIDKEFSIVKGSYKQIFSEQGYNAVHLVIKLKDDRLKLPEYIKFKGLKCEIQLTTVLFHAWSEIEHDTVYKPDENLEQFDKRTSDSLKKGLEEAMGYIKQAQYSFDYVGHQMEKVKEGKKIFDESFLLGIVSSKSNNELYENLKLLLKYIEEFGDKTPPKLDIVKVIEKVLKKAKGIKVEPIKTVFGEFPGSTFNDIADVCLDIINRLKFYKPKIALGLLVKIFEEVEGEKKKKALEIFGSLISYNLNILKQISFQIQGYVLETIESWKDEDLVKHFDIAVETVKRLLNPTFEGGERKDYKTFTFSHGSLKADKFLVEMRKRTILLGKKLYMLAPDLESKRGIINALQEGTRTSDYGTGEEKMDEVVLENVKELISFYLSVLPNAENEIIKQIEDQVYWFIQRFGKDKLDKVNELEASINSNELYAVYRIFVGYDARFSLGVDWRKAEELRKNKVAEFVDSVNQKKLNFWKDMLRKVLKNYTPNRAGEFQYLSNFFEQLGTRKPDLALNILQDNKIALGDTFLAAIVAGLWKSSRKKDVKIIIKNWIRKGKNLHIIPFVFGYIKELDIEIINEVFEVAKKKNDISTLSYIVKSIGWNYEDKKEYKLVLLKTIVELTRLKNCQWVHEFWFQCKKIIDSLSEKEQQIILNNLLIVEDINYEVEEILGYVADKSPLLVVEFFYNRIDIESNKGPGFKSRYQAVPFEFLKLKEHLAKYESIVLPVIINWYYKKGKSKWFYDYGAGKFLENVFPQFSKSLQDILIDLVNNKGKKGLEIALSILSKYEGEEFLLDTVKTIVNKYPSKKTEERLFERLTQTGVVSGEYGFVRAFQGKKAQIQKLKTDPNNNVRKFANSFDKYLDSRILYEQKRAEEEIEIRKREFTQ